MNNKRCGAFFFLLIMQCMGCMNTDSQSNQQRPTSQLPRLDIYLDKPVSSIAGTSWPRDTKTDKLCEVHAIEDSSFLTLTFPSKRTFVTEAKLVIIDQQDGKAHRVRLSPLRRVVTFRQAVIELEQIAKRLDVHNQPLIQRRLKEWTEEPSGNVSARADVEDRVSLFVEIARYIDVDGWYISLTFTYVDSDTWKRLHN